MTTTTTKSIEELKAELALAEQKLYEEEQEVARIEREAKYEAERKEREAAEAKAKLAFEVHAKEIVKELKAVGFHNANYIMSDTGKHPKIRCFAADNYPEWQVSFETSYNRDTWHSRENGTKIEVGQYSDKSRFPQLKAGGFNYKKIAATAWDKYQAALAKQKRENTEQNNQKSNEARIKRLVTQFGKPSYKGSDRNEIKGVSLHHYTYYNNNGRGGSYTYRTDNDLKLYIDHITEENAAKLIQFMLDNGMIAEEK